LPARRAWSRYHAASRIVDVITLDFKADNSSRTAIRFSKSLIRPYRPLLAGIIVVLRIETAASLSLLRLRRPYPQLRRPGPDPGPSGFSSVNPGADLDFRPLFNR